MLRNFFMGNEFRAYKIFGAHPKVKNKKAGVEFCVYAPNAKAVSLIGEFNGWTPQTMHNNEGIYTLFVSNASKGMMYKYRVYHDDGTFCDKADPYGFAMELRPGGASIVTDLSGYRFSDSEWIKNRDKSYNKPVNIYELHAGSWIRPDEGRFTSYRELTKKLIKYLKENNFTHIEFMPLLEHPLDASWGYQVTGFFAVTSRYGEAKDFMYLVNQCHKAGIGVIMDFVPVHFAVDEYGLGKFDGTPLYEYPDKRMYTQWGSYAFNFERPEVCSFLCSSVNFWIETYHIDGIRMDAVSNILYYNGDTSMWNSGGVEFIKKLNSGIEKRHPDIMMIAEDSSSYLKVTAPVEYDGLGFDYKWDMGWMNDTINFFKTPPIERKYHSGKIMFSMYYFYSELFMLPISHDENVHGKATILNKMWGDYDVKFEQILTFYTYMFAHPGKKLNFMGNEFGHFREWDENKECDWMLLDYEKHRRLNEYFKGLGRLYTTNPAMHDCEYNSNAFSWLTTDIERDCICVIERKNAAGSVIIVMNFDNRAVKNYTFGTDRYMKLKKVMDSNMALYSDIPCDDEIIESRHEGYSGKPYRISTDIAAFASKIYIEIK